MPRTMPNPDPFSVDGWDSRGLHSPLYFNVPLDTGSFAIDLEGESRVRPRETGFFEHIGQASRHDPVSILSGTGFLARMITTGSYDLNAIRRQVDDTVVGWDDPKTQWDGQDLHALWDFVNPVIREYLENRPEGFEPSRLAEDSENKDEYFNRLSRIVKAKQIDQEVTQNSTFWRGAARLGGELLTDPLNLISFGGSTIGKQFAVRGAKGILRAAGKEAGLEASEAIIKKRAKDFVRVTRTGRPKWLDTWPFQAPHDALARHHIAAASLTGGAYLGVGQAIHELYLQPEMYEVDATSPLGDIVASTFIGAAAGGVLGWILYAGSRGLSKATQHLVRKDTPAGILGRRFTDAETAALRDPASTLPDIDNVADAGAMSLWDEITTTFALVMGPKFANTTDLRGLLKNLPEDVTGEDFLQFLKLLPTEQEFLAVMQRLPEIRREIAELEAKATKAGITNLRALETFSRKDTGRPPQPVKVPETVPTRFATPVEAIRAARKANPLDDAEIILRGGERVFTAKKWWVSKNLVRLEDGRIVGINEILLVEDFDGTGYAWYNRDIWQGTLANSSNRVIPSTQDTARLQKLKDTETKALKRGFGQLKSTKYSRLEAERRAVESEIHEAEAALKDPTFSTRDPEQHAEVVAALTGARARHKGILNTIGRDYVNNTRIAEEVRAGPRQLVTLAKISSGEVVNPADQAKLLHEFMGDHSWGDYRRLDIGPLMKIYNFVEGIIDTGTARSTTHRHNISPLQAHMAALLDSQALTAGSLRADGGYVPNFHLMIERERLKIQRVLKDYNRFLETATDEQVEAVNKQIMNLLAGNTFDTAGHAEWVLKTATAMRQYFDEYLPKGIATGRFAPDTDPGYLPVLLNRTGGKDAGDALSNTLWEWWKRKIYLEGKAPRLHQKTLADMGILTKNAKGEYIPNEAKFGEYGVDAPKTLDTIHDLPARLRDEYLKNIQDIDGSLAAQARLSVSRKRGLTTVPEEEIATGARVANTELERKIEQEVFLTPELIESGAVESNPAYMLEWYMRNTAYYIQRDLAVQSQFGKGVKWETLIELARLQLADDTRFDAKKQAAIIQTFIDTEKAVNGRLVDRNVNSTQTLTHHAAHIGGSAASMLTATSGILAHVELLHGAVKANTGAASRVTGLKYSAELLRQYIKGVFRSGLSTRARAAEVVPLHGYGTHSRLVGGDDIVMVDRAPQNLRQTLKRRFNDGVGSVIRGEPVRSGDAGKKWNRVLGFFDFLVGGVRDLSLEDGILLRARLAYQEMARSRLSAYVQDGQLHKLADMDVNLERFDALEGPEVRALIHGELRRRSWTKRQTKEALLVLQAGLADKKMLAAWDWLNERKLVDLILEPNKLLPEIESHLAHTDPMRADLYELINRVDDYAIRHTNSTFMQPSPTSEILNKGPAHNFMNRLTAFPRQLAQVGGVDILNRPAAQAAAIMSTYVLAETAVTMFRDIVTGRVTVDELLTELHENPEEVVWRYGSRIPWLGPWTTQGANMLRTALGLGGRANLDYAGLSSITRMVGGVGGVMEYVWSGGEEKMTDSQIRGLNQLIPYMNTLPFELLHGATGHNVELMFLEEDE